MVQRTITIEALHEEICSLKRMMQGNKEVMTLSDVAAYTGLSLSYLYKLTMNNILPHAKPNGKQIFVSKVELDFWLMSNKAKTYEAIQQDAANYVTINQSKGNGGLNK